jgi:hypothetical protein
MVSLKEKRGGRKIQMERDGEGGDGEITGEKEKRKQTTQS